MQDRHIIRDQIGTLIKKGALRRCKSVPGQFISNIFIVPKPDGSYRLILNLKGLNKFITTEHFKLEDGKTVQKLITSECFMATIDLKDAYHLIRVKDSDRKFLRFFFEGELYEYTCLPFGLSTAPYTFTKLLKPVMTKLREENYLSVIYLDDLLVFGTSYAKCLKNVENTCSLLESLGFILNKNKSNLIPSTRCKYLGFIYDSKKMTLELPDEKKENLKKLIEKFEKKQTCIIREFSGFIGTLGSCCPTLKYGWSHMKAFEREKFLALKKNSDNYESRMTLSNDLQIDFDWWKSHVEKTSCPIKQFKPVIEIFSDASSSGWGVYCNANRTHGNWSNEEKLLHINYLELLAAFFGLKCFAKNLKNCDVLLRIDNTTAIAYINKMGGIQFQNLSNLAKEIWKWCEHRQIWIFASYISSKENIEADWESRRLEPETEYSLSQIAFLDIVKQFGTPEVDLFATRINAKCDLYVSWGRDPGSMAVDAFTLNWSKYFFYAFPPFSIILRVLRKIRDDGSKGIVVVPLWPAQAWFPVFNSMLVCKPIIFKPNIDLLRSFDRLPHPLWKRITLVAGLLSGKR